MTGAGHRPRSAPASNKYPRIKICLGDQRVLSNASEVSLSLVGEDNPSDPGSDGADSDSVNTLAQAGVDIDLNGPLPGGVVTVGVQLCA